MKALMSTIKILLFLHSLILIVLLWIFPIYASDIPSVEDQQGIERTVQKIFDSEHFQWGEEQEEDILNNRRNDFDYFNSSEMQTGDGEFGILPFTKPKDRTGNPLTGKEEEWDPFSESSDFAIPTCGGFGQLFWVLALVGLIVIIVYYLIRWLQNRSSRNEQKPKSLEDIAEETAAYSPYNYQEIMKRIQEFLQKQNYRQAIIFLYQNALKYLFENNYLQYNQSTTNWEYLRKLKNHPHKQSVIQTIIRLYEPIYFGRHQASESDFEIVHHSFIELLNTKDA